MPGSKRWIRTFCLALLTTAATPIMPALAGNCALYARAETGVALYGAAGGWWDQAEGRYRRGQKPAAGAILVFERSGHMPSGHVAVVAQVLGAREILVDQSNWFHGSTTHGDRVIDTSAANDWTMVSVGGGIRDNPTFGFIYPLSDAGGDPYLGGDRNAAAGLVRLAVARDEESIDDPPPRRTHHTARAHGRAKHHSRSAHRKAPGHQRHHHA